MANPAFTSWIAPWTCRACLRQSRAQTSTSSQIASQVRYSIRRPISSASHNVSKTVKPKRKRGRRILLAAVGTGGLATGLVAVSDDAKHYVTAAQRSGRVASTLALCVNDYRKTLNRSTTDPPEVYDALLKACHKRCAERTLVTLEKNGSIFIKLGQHLSSLNYLLPVEWCDTFIPLQDKCPVSSYESIHEMVRKDTGVELEMFFSEFEETPVGAASLAQVHRAIIRESGERVAVKVQHPSLDEWAKLDLALTRFTFQTLKYWFPGYDLTWLSEEMEASLPLELDFEQEGKNAIRAREYFSKLPHLPVVIPRVLWAKRRVLVMEYQTGHRPDDLAYLDANNISREEVSASLAHIFNEMIFGRDAPLHCDPHGGNIAIRLNPSRPKTRLLGGAGKNQNFDVILYDHGLYRDIPMSIRRAYAKLWLAVLDSDENRMRQYAKEVAGIGDNEFALFASAITGRDYSVIANSEKGGVRAARSGQEKRAISDALGEGGMLSDLVGLLGRVPRVLLLILKTNDLTRSLDAGLQTPPGSAARTFLILARYASRTVYDEQLDLLFPGDSTRTSRFFAMVNPARFFRWLGAWLDYSRVEMKLGIFETILALNRVTGLKIGGELANV